eukprot:SAG31_NODE_962_length_10731_cov_4.198552_9_plen_75_part_00
MEVLEGDVGAPPQSDVAAAGQRSLPFRDHFFDKIWCTNSPCFWPDLLTALREIRRVLKPAGRYANETNNALCLY